MSRTFCSIRTVSVLIDSYVLLMTDIDWTAQLVDQLDWHWTTFVRPHLDTLTDDEYRWEPVAGMWSIRPRGESTAPIQAGTGAGVIEFARPEPSPPPMTTIAWRMGHLAMVVGERAANHFGAIPLGEGAPSYETTDWPLHADAGLALLYTWYGRWIDGVRALDADGLARPSGPHEGPFADAPLATLVLHITREVLHHSAEILTMRDLYRNRPVNGDPS